MHVANGMPLAAIGAREEVPPCCVTVIVSLFVSRAQSTPCVPSARPLRTGTAPSALPMRPCRCPWALGVGARPVAPPGGALIRTARAAARAASCYNRIRRRVGEV